MNVLESEEMEEQLSSVLQRLRNEVKRRQLLVYPYLQDFDRVTSDHMILVIVTSSHFRVVVKLEELREVSLKE